MRNKYDPRRADEGGGKLTLAPAATGSIVKLSTFMGHWAGDGTNYISRCGLCLGRARVAFASSFLCDV